MNDSALSVTTRALQPSSVRGEGLMMRASRSGGAPGAAIPLPPVGGGQGGNGEAAIAQGLASGLPPERMVLPGQGVEPSDDRLRRSPGARPLDPSQADPAHPDPAHPDSAHLDATHLKGRLESLNSMLKASERKLEFSVDDSSGRTVIKVKDAENDEVIRQIPPETALEFMEKLEEGLDVMDIGLMAEA